MKTLALVIALTLVTGCSWLHSKPGQNIIDCTGLDKTQLELEGAALLALIPDWKAIEDKAVTDIAKEGVKVVGCALAEVTQDYLSKPQASADASWTAHDALERFRSAHAGGATFHTGQGDL